VPGLWRRPELRRFYLRACLGPCFLQQQLNAPNRLGTWLGLHGDAAVRCQRMRRAPMVRAISASIITEATPTDQDMHPIERLFLGAINQRSTRRPFQLWNAR
jgi:hypothetical protein